MQRGATDKPPVLILINHDSDAQHVTLPHGMHNLLYPQSSASTTIDLQPHGVAVLSEEPRQ
jgi:beta-galactosidase GanA